MKLRPVLAAALSLLSASICEAQEAPSFQIDPAHTGSTSFPGGLKLPLRQVWTVSFPDPVFYPIIADGKVFVTTGFASGQNGSAVYALSAATGEVLWRATLSASTSGTRAFAIFDNGKLFVATTDGFVRNLDAATGVQIWYFGPDGNISDPPTAQNGIIYAVYQSAPNVGSGSSLLAARESDGAIIWTKQFELPQLALSGPTLSADGVFLAGTCAVLQLAADDGSPRWSRTADCGPDPPYEGFPSAYYDDKLFTSFSLHQYQVAGGIERALDGTLLAAVQSHIGYGTASVTLPPTIDHGLAYYNESGVISAISTVTGATVWSFGGGYGTTFGTAPILVNGHVIANSIDTRQLDVLDGGTGAVQQLLPVPVSRSASSNHAMGLSAGEGIITIPFYNALTAYAGAQ